MPARNRRRCPPTAHPGIRNCSGATRVSRRKSSRTFGGRISRQTSSRLRDPSRNESSIGCGSTGLPVRMLGGRIAPDRGRLRTAHPLPVRRALLHLLKQRTDNLPQNRAQFQPFRSRPDDAHRYAPGRSPVAETAWRPSSPATAEYCPVPFDPALWRRRCPHMAPDAAKSNAIG